jgi:hypothetical protein
VPPEEGLLVGIRGSLPSPVDYQKRHADARLPLPELLPVASDEAGVKDPTLATMIEVVKAKPRIRFLVCATCQRDVKLKGGIYVCGEGHTFESLRELVVKQ